MLDLQFNFSDTDAFVDLLNSPNLWKELPFGRTTDDAFSKACEKYLLSGINRVKVIRGFTVRCFYSHVKTCFSEPVKVKIHPFRSGYGYMLDRGEVHILADLLFKAPQMEFISVLLHETAHIALSQWDCYHKLLQLDALFAEKYFKDQHNSLLSTVTPVEFYAQLLADHWLRQAAARSSGGKWEAPVQKQLQGMQQKLLSAVALLNKIKNQNNS